jgi:hypothetical protein
MRESEDEPRGAIAHQAIILPFPLPVGNKIIVGGLNGSNLDPLLTIELTRRLGMGPYRVFFGLFPDVPLSVAKAVQ